MRPSPTTRHAAYLSLLAVLDCFLTYTILFVFPAYGVYGAELNGLAHEILENFGFGGMVVLKALSVMPAMGVMKYVSGRSQTASRVLSAATLSVAGFPVVVALGQMVMLAMGVTH